MVRRPLSRPVGRWILVSVVLLVWSLHLVRRSATHSDLTASADASLFDAMVLMEHAKARSNATDSYLPSVVAFQWANAYSECLNKERLLDRVLGSTHNDNRIDHALRSPADIQALCRSLPTYQELMDIYGKGPVILGQETCRQYQDMLHNSYAVPLQPMPRVAGLYHSGTNALAKTLELNLGRIHNYSPWNPYEVPWGKHIPVAKYRLRNKFPENNPDSPEHVLPIVIVRNPFDWMRSMCREGYDAKWAKRGLCPQLLVPSNPTMTIQVSVKAHQTHFRYMDHYKSLAEFWTEWHEQYLEASFPRLLIRYEDLVLYPQEIVKAIANCTGQNAKPVFASYGEEARAFVAEHIEKKKRNMAQQEKLQETSLIKALVKLGQWDAMYWTMPEPSRAYALQALKPELLKLFQYKHLDDPQVPATRPLYTYSIGPNRRHKEAITKFMSPKSLVLQAKEWLSSPRGGRVSVATSHEILSKRRANMLHRLRARADNGEESYAQRVPRLPSEQ